MQRICVLGTSGSGKSTLAQTLATNLNLKFIDSDALYWQSGWKPAAHSDLEHHVRAATEAQRWVFDGNFLSLRHWLWLRADNIVWLDYERRVVMWRVVRRNFLLWLRRTQFWNGNRMNLSRAISGIHHAWRSYSKKRYGYPALFSQFRSLEVVHLITPCQTEQWVKGLG